MLVCTFLLFGQSYVGESGFRGGEGDSCTAVRGIHTAVGTPTLWQSVGDYEWGHYTYFSFQEE